MKTQIYLKNIAIFLSLLFISLPFTFAQEYSRIYDGNGNLISDGAYYREYNGLNQLIRVRLGNTSTSPILEEYKWHPIEERIIIKRVFSNGVYNYTVYYPNENFVQIVNSSGTFNEKYIYQDGVLIAQVNSDGQKQAVHSNHEGSSTLITDSRGNVVENTFFSPYGEILEGGKSSRYGYESKEYDSLVDDIDFKFRKYNPKIPIPHQPDTLIKNVYDPQNLNRYMFERGNPYRYTDPTGHDLELVALLFFFVFYSSIVVGSYIYYKQTGERQARGIDEQTSLTDNPQYKEIERQLQQNQKQAEIPPATAQDVLTISDNAAKSMEVNTKEKVSDTTQYKIIEKSELSEEDLKRIKKPLGTIEPPPIKIEIVKDKDKAKVSSSGSGGWGGSDFVPDPSGRKDRFGNPVYVPKSEIRRRR